MQLKGYGIIMLKTKQRFKIKEVTHTYTKDRRPWAYFFTALLALIISVSVFWDDLVCFIPYCSNDVAKYVISSNPDRKIAANGSEVSICGTDGLYVVSPDGTDAASFITAFPDPLMSVSNHGTAAASKNSKEFYVLDKKGNSRQTLTDYPILNIKLSDGGYTAAITNQPGYNGAVTVYDRKGTALFNWAAGKSNLIDAAVSENGRILAVSCADFSENTLNCKLLLFNISKSPDAYATLEFGNNLVSSVSFSGNKILCVGDRAFICYSSSGAEKWRLDYGEKMLNFYDVSQKNNLVFVLGTSSLDRNMSVMSYSSSGRRRGTYSGEFDVSHICATKNRIILASKRKLLAISPYGRLKNTKTLEKDILAISAYNSGNRVFVDEGGSAEIFMFK